MQHSCTVGKNSHLWRIKFCQNLKFHDCLKSHKFLFSSSENRKNFNFISCKSQKKISWLSDCKNWNFSALKISKMKFSYAPKFKNFSHCALEIKDPTGLIHSFIRGSQGNLQTGKTKWKFRRLEVRWYLWSAKIQTKWSVGWFSKTIMIRISL